MATTDYQCVYASETTGVHDKRWLAALAALKMNPLHIARDQHGTTREFLHAIGDESRSELPIIAGPLALAQVVSQSESNVVLLSWGFDLQQASQDLDLRAFRGVIVDSLANERVAVQAGANRILRLPWGVDLETIDRDGREADLSAFGIDPGQKVVLSLRAHEQLYRVADILEAFAHAPNEARLVIGNTGSLTPQLRELNQELAVGAVFLDPVPETDVIPLLKRASVYVTASDVDGTSVTLLQAMGSEVPVVASANAGNVDWITDGVTGYLFPIGDVPALAEAIRQALRTESTVTQAAREQVENRADWKHNIQILGAFLSQQ